MTNFPEKFLSATKRWFGTLRHVFQKSENAKRADSNLALQQVVSARKKQGLPTGAQIKHFPTLLDSKEKKIASIAAALVIIAGILLARQLINSQRLVMPAVGGEYTEGLVGTPQLINPLYSMTSDVDNDLTKLIYSGLMRYDTANGLVNDLAESYEISEDGKTYTFVIRDNARWHDGEKVLADDVVFTISAIQNSDYRSPMEYSFADVIVEQVDDRTVSFTLENEFAPFLSFLTIGILPSHLWQEVAPFNATLTELNKKPIGSGPYVFEKLIRDSNGNIRSYELKRNSDYYSGAPYIETLTFKFYSDINSAVDALNNHNIEGLSYVPTSNLNLFEKDGSIQILFPEMHQYTALFLNEDNNSILEDDDVREALAMATNKDELVQNILLGHGRAIDSFILPGMLGYYPEVTKYSYDLEAAKQKLSNAGWIPENETSQEASATEESEESENTTQEETETDQIQEIPQVTQSTTRVKDGEYLKLQIVTIEAEELINAAEAIKTQWEQLGVLVDVKTVTAAELQTDILKNRNYDILLSGELYGVDTDPYAFWHSSQANYPGLNLAQFSSSKADDYIETGRTTLDETERAEAYQSLQDLVADELPAIFLYQPFYSYATSDKIQGITILNMTTPADRFSRINEWHIKTRKVFSKSQESIDNIQD